MHKNPAWVKFYSFLSIYSHLSYDMVNDKAALFKSANFRDLLEIQCFNFKIRLPTGGRTESCFYLFIIELLYIYFTSYVCLCI